MALPPFLTKQLGPLPVGAWAGAIAAGLGVSYYLRQRSGGGDDDGAGNVTSVAGIPNVVPMGAGTAEDQGYIFPQPTGDGSAFVTLEQWAGKAITALINAGVAPLTADLAIRKYVNGSHLNASESAVINQALSLVGPAPALLFEPSQEVPSSPHTPAPSAPTPRAPSTPSPVRAPRVTQPVVRQPVTTAPKYDAVVAKAVTRAGHDYATVVDEADVRAALRRIGHDPGQVINQADIDVLVRRTS